MGGKETQKKGVCDEEEKQKQKQKQNAKVECGDLPQSGGGPGAAKNLKKVGRARIRAECCRGGGVVLRQNAGRALARRVHGKYACM